MEGLLAGSTKKKNLGDENDIPSHGFTSSGKTAPTILTG